jgi:pyridoxal phosphate enzyme (YggS family)
MRAETPVPGEAADRRAEIAENLRTVRARIEAACRAVGRSPAEVTLVAVTKTYPASDVGLLLVQGLRDFGENRDQEAARKAASIRADFDVLWPGDAPRWHFIGQLQTNKVRSVVSYADVVQSVDRLKLVAALGEAAQRAGRRPGCFVQVNLDPESSGRGGAEPGEVERIADAVAETPALRLDGVMAVAPVGTDPAAAFERLAEVAAKVRGAHSAAVSLSAGMSGDLEAAVAAGATHVRIGSALLGARAPLR